MISSGIPALLLSLAQIVLSPIGVALNQDAQLDRGFRQMYNLQFAEAHETFRQYQKSHPGDAMGPTADAAAYLFSEFERLGILQTELFIDDQIFENRRKPAPDAVVRDRFLNALEQSRERADAMLVKSPGDQNSRLARVLDFGLESDYLAMVEKRNMAALSSSKKGSQLAEELLKTNPDCYDAYLAVGIENYLLGLKPFPVRWVLQLYGARTDKEEGIRKLQLTAEHGHFLLPYARLMLAVAALRENDRGTARVLLADLAQEFPGNTLYRRELARLQ